MLNTECRSTSLFNVQHLVFIIPSLFSGMPFAILPAKRKAMGKRILIVDDNEFMVEIMTYILNNKGYDVTSLYTGDEVFNTIKTAHPDLVILDMKLPDMDGRDICKLLKLNRSTKDLPVIMCSGEDEVTEVMNQRGGPDDILQKPFDIDSLVAKVEVQLAA
jgi:DNA-binding response OmpR family regulator